MTHSDPEPNALVDLPPTHELVPHIQESARRRNFDLGMEASRQLVEFMAVILDAIRLHREAKRGRADERQGELEDPDSRAVAP